MYIKEIVQMEKVTRGNIKESNTKTHVQDPITHKSIENTFNNTCVSLFTHTWNIPETSTFKKSKNKLMSHF